MIEVSRIGPDDAALVRQGADLFDSPLDDEHLARFLGREGHHLLVALDDARRPLGFVSGVEMTHPDKGTEMLLYELSVGEAHRRQGVGTTLVRALADLASSRGCYGMWVLTDDDNSAALATYRGTVPAAESRHVMFTWEPLPPPA